MNARAGNPKSPRARSEKTGPSGDGVSDGTRTRGHLDHNQVLYQLSYTHHLSGRFLAFAFPAPTGRTLQDPRGCSRQGFPVGRITPEPGRRPDRRAGQAVGTWCLAAISRAASVSGPGCGTNTASR